MSPKTQQPTNCPRCGSNYKSTVNNKHFFECQTSQLANTFEEHLCQSKLCRKSVEAQEALLRSAQEAHQKYLDMVELTTVGQNRVLELKADLKKALKIANWYEQRVDLDHLSPGSEERRTDEKLKRELDELTFTNGLPPRRNL
jgi:hypothetical protein